jgi:Circadian oscillating protein COP23
MFYCDINGSVPITKIRTSRGDEDFIQWVHELGGYGYQKRCLEVSKRFSLAVSRGQLLLKTDQNFNGSPVVCSIYKLGDHCTHNNILVTLKSKDQLKRAYSVFTEFRRNIHTPVRATRTGSKSYLTLTDHGDYFDLGRMLNDYFNKPVNSPQK